MKPRKMENKTKTATKTKRQKMAHYMQFNSENVESRFDIFFETEEPVIASKHEIIDSFLYLFDTAAPEFDMAELNRIVDARIELGLADGWLHVVGMCGDDVLYQNIDLAAEPPWCECDICMRNRS